MSARDVAKYLDSQGLGTFAGDIFVNTLPDKPDNCIALFDTGGEPSDPVNPTHKPGLQVTVRNSVFRDAMTKIQSVQNELHGLSNTTLNGVYYLHIFNNQQPIPMPRDSTGRAIIRQNYRTAHR